MSSTRSTSMAIIGDGSVGKSAVINAFKSEGFLSVYKQTVGFEVYEKKLRLREDTLVSLQLWDIGGQSINSKNLEKYLSSAKAVFIVYDTTNRESFMNVDDWLAITRRWAKPETLVYLVGNKVDLIALRQVSQSQHEDYVAQNDLKSGFFFSAKTGENVLRSFYKAAGESIGVRLTAQELACLDKVVRAHVQASGEDEGRTDMADQIEAEDRANQLRAHGKGGCVCS